MQPTSQNPCEPFHLLAKPVGPICDLVSSPRPSGSSPALLDMFSPERTWQHANPAKPVAAGLNRFELTGLKPDTTYHFRLFVHHDEGKSWDSGSGNFRTPP